MYLILDLETTGLDPTRNTILEIGAIGLNEHLRPAFTYERLIHQQEPMRIEPGAHDLHVKNGLLADLADPAKTKVSLEQAQAELIDALAKTCGASDYILCGNNPQFDRGFVGRLMPGIDAVLSFRNLDVSSLRYVAGAVTGVPHARLKAAFRPNAQQHRALADCHACLTELQTFASAMYEGKEHIKNYVKT